MTTATLPVTAAKTPRNWPYIITTVIVWALMLGTLYMSSTDIVITAHKIGLHDIKAWTSPGLVDVIAIVGKLGRLDRFSADSKLRRSSFLLMLLGGSLSLVCNVYAGENFGERAYGVVLVGAFLLLENHASKLKPAVPVPVLTPRQAGAVKAAQTKAAKAAALAALPAPTPQQRAATTRRRNREAAAVLELERDFAMAAAPISGA